MLRALLWIETLHLWSASFTFTLLYGKRDRGSRRVDKCRLETTYFLDRDEISLPKPAVLFELAQWTLHVIWKARTRACLQWSGLVQCRILYADSRNVLPYETGEIFITSRHNTIVFHATHSVLTETLRSSWKIAGFAYKSSFSNLTLLFLSKRLRFLCYASVSFLHVLGVEDYVWL